MDFKIHPLPMLPFFLLMVYCPLFVRTYSFPDHRKSDLCRFSSPANAIEVLLTT